MMIIHDNSNSQIGKMCQILARQRCWERVWKLKNKTGKRNSLCILCSKEVQSLSQEGRVNSKKSIFILIFKLYIVLNRPIAFFFINRYAFHHFIHYNSLWTSKYVFSFMFWKCLQYIYLNALDTISDQKLLKTLFMKTYIHMWWRIAIL